MARFEASYGALAQYRKQQRELKRQDQEMRKRARLAAARYRKEEVKRKKEQRRIAAMLKKQAKRDRKAFSRNPPSKRKQRKMAARVRWADTPAKKNAPRMKRLNKSTPWIPATAVKIVRNKGRYEVLYRRKRSAVKKRPARRKTARRR